jgi:hypothetical protein
MVLIGLHTLEWSVHEFFGVQLPGKLLDNFLDHILRVKVLNQLFSLLQKILISKCGQIRGVKPVDQKYFQAGQCRYKIQRIRIILTIFH